MTETLLLELGCEDLPARYVVTLAEALGAGITGGLAKRGITGVTHKIFATPRRIAVLADKVPTHQPEQRIERLGPAVAAATKDGQPTPAALGFARSCGVEFSALAQKDGKLHFSKTAPGKPTAELIPEIFKDTLKSMDELVPKRMRWGSGEETFVRPVQWIVALLGNTVIPLKRFGLIAANITHGHRFHAPAAIELKSPADYEAALQGAKVWADVSSRKAEIKRQIEAEALKLGGTARITEDLLDEVTALVEWPVVISGHMEARFMQLPPEVIIATVETNQRYFTVFAGEKLLPVFITISNIESRDVAQVIAGNERVVRPRLSDAMFFWEQDCKQPLVAYGEKLNAVTFQKELGTIADKVSRVRKLATEIAKTVPSPFSGEGQGEGHIERAAALCKNDLVTRMVYEFPELQGIMGGYYAEKSGEPPSVAKAISEHYLPTQQGTPIPSTIEGQIVALADKLDTLVGIFAIDQKPTASKDPFALRRTGLGILRICIEGRLPLDLKPIIFKSLSLVNETRQSTGVTRGELPQEILDFIFDRLPAVYSEQQLPIEMFAAVKSVNISTPLDFDARVQALRGFWALPEAKNLAAAHKRIRNILKQAGEATGPVSESLLEHEAEKFLFGRLVALETANEHADYAGKLQNLATLREPVDAFFESVMVNAENPAVRANRLALLKRLDIACREIVNISCLPG